MLAQTNTGLLPFRPHDYGFQVYSSSTGCYRGYRSQFDINDDRLVLESVEMDIGTNRSEFKRKRVPRFNNVEGKPLVYRAGWYLFGGDFHVFDYNKIDYSVVLYQNIELQVAFTGGMLLGQRREFPMMMYPNGFSFERVLEMVFCEGVLEEVADCSSAMADIRDGIDWNFYHGVSHSKGFVRKFYNPAVGVECEFMCHPNLQFQYPISHWH